MTDVAFINRLRFISGADEKVTRVFDAPAGFVETLQSLGISKGGEDAVSGAKSKRCLLTTFRHRDQRGRRCRRSDYLIERWGEVRFHVPESAR